MSHAPTADDVARAAERIAPHALRTPVLRADALDARVGAQLWFKCENLQRTGAFKFRGACNAVLGLTPEQARHGVVTQSSGNHGAALAAAARLRGVVCHVVVPNNTLRSKLANMQRHGAEIALCEPNMAARNALCADLQARTGATLVHPFDDAQVIAGQGTAVREMLAEVGTLDTVVAPVGGGGLLSGSALAAHAHDARIVVIGAEPEQARDAHDSLAGGVRITDRVANTICDGLRGYLGALGFDILRAHGARIELASEADIVAAMRLVWQELKLVVESSSAVALAILLRQPERWRGQRIGVVLSGGNVDLDALPWCAQGDQS
jgi:threonine dehydratase